MREPSDPETALATMPELPPLIFLPCTAHVRDPSEAVIELRWTTDHQLAIVAYSSIEQLAFCCGRQQPWLAMPKELLARYREVQPFDLVLLDVVIPPTERAIQRSADGGRPELATGRSRTLNQGEPDNE